MNDWYLSTDCKEMKFADAKTYSEGPPSHEEIYNILKERNACCAFIWKGKNSDRIAQMTDGCRNKADKLVNAGNN